MQRPSRPVVTAPGRRLPDRTPVAAGRAGCIALLLVVGACHGPPPGADQRRAARNELDPSGRPYDGPAGPVSSAPPSDNNDARLRCHPEGEGILCDR